MAKKRTLDTIFLLQIALGLFFLVLGVLAFLDYDSAWNSIQRGFGDSQVIEILVAVAFLICGLILLAALFIPVKTSTLQLAILIVFLLWLVLLIFNNFILIDFSKMDIISARTDLAEKNAFKYLLVWIRNFSTDLVMLCSVWVIRSRRYL